VLPREVSHERFYQTMDELSELSEQSYRELTDNTEGFFEYFYQATPVSEIGLMNIGSRPSHRRKGDMSKSSVRAIPWVFGWAQSRHTLPAWYGMGGAISEWIKRHPEQGIEMLQQMYDEWPFFHSMISNTRMALNKSNMQTASDYAQLCENAQIRDTVFGMIDKENAQTIEKVLKIAQAERLLSDDPLLELSLSRREPYLDPLNYIQINLLKKFRDESVDEQQRESWKDAMLSSINAIAAGMRNTG
jgi:phosphoenolpyruvate carboxylase